MSRIVWKDTPRGQHGRVGDYPLFRIAWDSIQSSPENRWRLVTELPLTMDRDHFETVDDAKAYAEDVVDEFVRRLGVAFPDPS